MAANKEVRYGFNKPIWDTVNSDTKDFIALCLRPTAEERITPEQAKRHPFVRTSYKAVEATKHNNKEPQSSSKHDDGNGESSRWFLGDENTEKTQNECTVM